MQGENWHTITAFSGVAYSDPLTLPDDPSESGFWQSVMREIDARPIKYLVLDVSKCDASSSLAIGEMSTVHRQLQRNGGGLILVGPRRNMQAACGTTTSDELFIFVDTIEEAALRYNLNPQVESEPDPEPFTQEEIEKITSEGVTMTELVSQLEELSRND